MKKKLLFTLLIPCIAVGAKAHSYGGNNMHAFKENAGQTIKAIATIKGTVKDTNGEPLVGVNIALKGTDKGTQSDVNGNFTIEANAGDVLVFTYIGYNKTEVKVTGPTVNVVLTADSKQLTEVVVTALGVKRSEKSLVYANQVVGGSELNAVKSDNLMNSLNGKVAGVDISPSSSGVGGSVKVILRGSKNTLQGNQPLYVIDGVPITNTSNSNGQPNGTYGGSPDGGDGISNLNPDDIESITVLEGAAASALYGYQAANGVILVTTKKGKAGKAQINFSSSYLNDAISYKPKFQNEYGETPNGNQSWGAKLSTPSTANNLGDFYQHGNNYTNAFNFTSGSDLAQTYFSYANTTANGVQPTNSLERNNFTFRETAHFLNNKLTLDVNTNYITQKIDNTPGEGFYFNTLPGLYLFPVGVDILPYKNNYGVPQPARNGLLTQNWVANEDIQQNPWWILYKNPNYSTRNRALFNASLKYDVADWLNIQVRGNVDRVADTWEQDLYAGTNAVLSVANGQYTRTDQTLTQSYGDAIANFKVPMKSDFKIDGLVGASITDDNTIGTKLNPGLGLAIPNVFIQQNVLTSTSTNAATLPSNRNQVQSIFGSVNFSYKGWAYLTVTERNDWASTLASLAGTNNFSYSYPSIGLSFILSDMFKLPDFISYAKIRGSYAEVASPIPPYLTNPINYLAGGGAVNFNQVEVPDNLKPTDTKSKEGGVDLKLLNNKLNFSFTYYESNSYNQFIQYTPSSSSIYTTGYLNAGNIQNQGVELTLGYDILKSSDFGWNSSLNYSSNKNKVIELNPAAPTTPVILTGSGPNAYESALAVGGSYGDIYGVKYERNAAGQIMVNSSGAPINNGTFVKLGNPNPKFQMGWSNSFNYKKFSLNFLVDGKFGGQVMSMTQMLMDSYGTSLVTGQARDAGGVTVNAVDPSGKAVTKVDAYTWYSTIGGRSGIAEAYMYSATVVRLRQASLGYNFPVTSGFIKTLRLSVIGNNLLYFYKKAPYDPEVTMSTGNGLSGVDVFNQPTTRRIGAQLNVTF
ncbi:TonB-linked SusC/RagA family outer membrane protein [Mucilaginibacter frigoritolerans]|uniref:TonB-linked SusC/RagA family outer membrane protein n=1 Tax=Mucilaginibacter frigoritolerans TaxID=652788 RepID=A0A562TXC1_9SPHI|nr:SusC/RagA family TonB-linked outer membrane protein [Mucilaginibacter frigoritolerans]TWI98217.1 TonB-linked SusC/RagA family outer membrane protein [Mucilaginibacter frigoritolerans]